MIRRWCPIASARGHKADYIARTALRGSHGAHRVDSRGVDSHRVGQSPRLFCALDDVKTERAFDDFGHAAYR